MAEGGREQQARCSKAATLVAQCGPRGLQGLNPQKSTIACKFTGGSSRDASGTLVIAYMSLQRVRGIYKWRSAAMLQLWSLIAVPEAG